MVLPPSWQPEPNGGIRVRAEMGRRAAVATCAWGAFLCSPPRSAFAGFRFPAEVIVVAVRWYLRYGLSYRDVEELLAERGIEVDHVTVYRWVQRFTPLLADAARFAPHAPGDRWFVDVREGRCWPPIPRWLGSRHGWHEPKGRFGRGDGSRRFGRAPGHRDERRAQLAR